MCVSMFGVLFCFVCCCFELNWFELLVLLLLLYCGCGLLRVDCLKFDVCSSLVDVMYDG